MITLSSDSEDESEVQIVGSYSNKNEILPLSSVRVEVNALNIETSVPCIDLTLPRSANPERNIASRKNPAPLEVVDLTEDKTIEVEQQSPTSNFESSKTSPKNSIKDLEAANICVKRRILKSKKALLTRKSLCHRSTSVKLKRLSILENNLKELLTLDRKCSIKTQTMSLYFKKGNNNGVCPDLSNTTTAIDHKPSQDKSCQEQASGSHKESPLAHCDQADFNSELQISQPTFLQDTDEVLAIPTLARASSSGKAQNSIPSPSLPVGATTVHPPPGASRNGSPAHPTTVPSEDDDSLPQTIPKCESLKTTKELKPQSDHVTSDKASLSCSQTPQSSLSASRTGNLAEELFTYEDEFEVISPETFSWGERDEENESFELYCTSVTEDDKYYVCPTAFKNRKQRRADFLTNEEDATRTPQMLCRQSLSLVYSTIDESYQEGTLQLLSDLLQPAYYPPKDITSHLLWGILLNPQSPHHNCVHAYDLLMRTQRYQIADKCSAPWDWERLSNVMEKQDHRPEILFMFLEYVVQTLEDDFKAKQTTSAIYQSLAKSMLSFDHFPHIRDVCKWLFSAIVKSTDCNDFGAEHIRIVTIFQRMLSLALEVDCSPAICSAKLSQELFHMLISRVSLRPQRMMLLKSLQSKLLKCKLLEHLLDYSCPAKTSVPMSLSLLLHFLKNCTLSPDPKDGTEKWRRWEELVSLLWMLLLSYNSAMKGYLSGSKTERRHSVGPSVYKPEDMVSKCAVLEAVEVFLSRSKDDVGEALPMRVEESLTYLQDYLLDVCQC